MKTVEVNTLFEVEVKINLVDARALQRGRKTKESERIFQLIKGSKNFTCRENKELCTKFSEEMRVMTLAGIRLRKCAR